MSIISKTVDNKSNLTVDALNIDSFSTTTFNNILASKYLYNDVSGYIFIEGDSKKIK